MILVFCPCELVNNHYEVKFCENILFSIFMRHLSWEFLASFFNTALFSTDFSMFPFVKKLQDKYRSVLSSVEV